MKDKAFAAKVNREDIVRGAEELGMPLDDLIGEVIVALQAEAGRLELEGTQQQGKLRTENREQRTEDILNSACSMFFVLYSAHTLNKKLHTSPSLTM